MTTFPNVKSSVKKYTVARNAFLPRYVIVPMVQESGVQCKPVVQKGNFVDEGQVIAVPQGLHDCKIHSPVPGKVVDIFTDVSASGRPELMVKIALQGSFSYTGKKHQVSDSYKNMTPSLVAEKLAESGVINTFKINNPVSLSKEIFEKSENAKTLVVRLFDEDPVRLTDSFISAKYFQEIRKGAQIVAYAAKFQNILYIYDQAAENSFEVNPSFEKTLSVNAKKYPAGFKKEICRAFNKSGKKNEYQISEEDIFSDATTMYEVYKAVELGIPPVEHLVQFTGNCIAVNCVLNVRLGTTLDDIVNQIGGFTRTPNFIIINGHVVGNSVTWRNFPITKFVKSISFVSERNTPEQLVHACISCGNCRSICPRELAPDLLYKSKIEQFALPPEYFATVSQCSECGLCNSVCPSRIPLTQVLSVMKNSK